MTFHFVDLTEPAIFTNAVKVNCGLVIEKALPRAMVDSEWLDGTISNSRNICRTCYRSEWSKRFRYVVSSAQEVLDASQDD